MKPNITVNLDNVYVKKPCAMGAEISAKIDIKFAEIERNITELSTDLSNVISSVTDLSSEIGETFDLDINEDPTIVDL